MIALAARTRSWSVIAVCGWAMIRVRVSNSSSIGGGGLLRLQRGHGQAFDSELLVIHLGLLEGSGPHRGCPVVVDAVGHGPRPVRRHVGDDLDEGGGHVFECVVVVVKDDNPPVRVVFLRGVCASV